MLEAILLLKAKVQIGSFTVAILIALVKGGVVERACALTFAAMLILDAIYHAATGPGLFVHTNVNVGHLVIDTGVAVSFVVIGAFANRIYPICLAGLQLASVCDHLLRYVQPQSNLIAYRIFGIAPSYLEIVTFAAAMWLHYRRVARFGPYPDWRGSLRRS